jgi:hypothetical protein
VEAVLMRKGYPFRSARPGAWRMDEPGEPVSWPTHEAFGAHDLAPLADADLPAFTHWRPMLGIEPTAAEARRRGVPIEGWMGIEPEPERPGGTGPSGGVLVELTPKQDIRLAKLADTLRRGGKWTDIDPYDRWRLGRVFDKILQPLARRIASSEIASSEGAKEVLHWAKVDDALIKRLRAAGGFVLITEARLLSGRVDFLMIDFDRNRVQMLDVTSVEYTDHVAKSAGYRNDLSKLLHMPVNAIEALYVGTDGDLLNTLLEEAVPSE